MVDSEFDRTTKYKGVRDMFLNTFLDMQILLQTTQAVYVYKSKDYKSVEANDGIITSERDIRVKLKHTEYVLLSDGWYKIKLGGPYIGDKKKRA